MKKAIAVIATLAAAGTAAAESTGISPAESRSSLMGAAENFSGTVIVEPIFPANEFNTHNTGHVTFAPGARTAWHTHPGGQLIIITDGAGWVQEEGGEKRLVRAGDAGWFPPNVNHRHGATDTTAMRHIALTYMEGDSNVTWRELVSDEAFAAPVAD